LEEFESIGHWIISQVLFAVFVTNQFLIATLLLFHAFGFFVARLEDPLLKLHTSLTRLEFKSHTTKVLATKKDDAQEESVLEQLKYTSVKEEPFIKGDMSMSCDDITDVPNPGWFGKGIRKSKSRKRRK